ncbi:MAG TPA: hypothetical protein EYH16_03660 [Leucothrix mucor]|nr:hypothetical protein [Leucothrix mucor]
MEYLYLFFANLFAFFLLSFLTIRFFRKTTKAVIIEFILFFIYCASLFLFFVGFLFSGDPYHKAIDPVDNGYSPFGEQHYLTLIVFYLFYVVSAILLWLKGRELPPLILVLSVVFLCIGIVISTATLMQLTLSTGSDYFNDINDYIFFSIMPLFNLIFSILLLIKIIREEASASTNRVYKNKILNWLNKTISHTQHQPYWVIALLIPVFVMTTLILTLFGQDTDAMIKVFTDTTTWRFSQQTHPPYLDHTGHYLCTVAVCGNPKIVKPLRLGYRHGNEIIVNRQLLIANAFEEMIHDYSPTLHHYIRSLYNKYGYPFSKHITTPMQSSITYLIMKPFEWLFLLTLYLFCINPEDKIKKQYT